MWFGKVDQVEDEMIISDDDEELFDETLEADDLDEELEEKIKQIQQSKDQSKVPTRARSGEILPTKSWRRQSTFRKQSMAQILEIGTLSQQSSQKFLPPLTVSNKDKQLNVKTDLAPIVSKPTEPLSPLRRGSVLRRPTLRANSIENAKLCVTNDLEDFIEVF